MLKRGRREAISLPVPRIYRSMRAEGGKPVLGSTSATLGVRVPDTLNASVEPDIPLDDAGLVHPGTGGMSVSPSPGHLPARRIPQRLRHRYPKAAGSDKLMVWAMGDGPFVDDAITGNLRLRLDPENRNHGFVEPAAPVLADAYVTNINLTRDLWEIEEGGTP